MDLGDRLLAPAFVNSHTHLAMVAFRGLLSSATLKGNVVTELFFNLETHLTPEDVYAFACMGMPSPFELLEEIQRSTWGSRIETEI